MSPTPSHQTLRDLVHVGLVALLHLAVSHLGGILGSVLSATIDTATTNEDALNQAPAPPSA